MQNLFYKIHKAPPTLILKYDLDSRRRFRFQHDVRAVSYTHLDVYKRQGKASDKGVFSFSGQRKHFSCNLNQFF